jgi:hypothetical protein
MRARASPARGGVVCGRQQARRHDARPWRQQRQASTAAAGVKRRVCPPPPVPTPKDSCTGALRATAGFLSRRLQHAGCPLGALTHAAAPCPAYRSMHARCAAAPDTTAPHDSLLARAAWPQPCSLTRLAQLLLPRASSTVGCGGAHRWRAGTFNGGPHDSQQTAFESNRLSGCQLGAAAHEQGHGRPQCAQCGATQAPAAQEPAAARRPLPAKAVWTKTGVACVRCARCARPQLLTYVCILGEAGACCKQQQAPRQAQRKPWHSEPGACCDCVLRLLPSARPQSTCICVPSRLLALSARGFAHTAPAGAVIAGRGFVIGTGGNHGRIGLQHAPLYCHIHSTTSGRAGGPVDARFAPIYGGSSRHQMGTHCQTSADTTPQALMCATLCYSGC